MAQAGKKIFRITDAVIAKAMVMVTAGLILASCSTRQDIAFVEQPTVGTHHSVLLATTRERTLEAQSFGHERATQPSFAQFVVSVPPTHETGSVEWPKGEPNPATDFVTVSEQDLQTVEGLTRQLNANLRQFPRGQREAVVFVHGFNVTFSEALYSFTQITHDFNIQGAPVLFSWPSAGRISGYIYDRDSVAIARDKLQVVLEAVVKSDAEGVILVAHSMGGFLAMETMRQMAIEGDRAFRRKLGGVILLSPDIDLEVFKSQVARIGDLPQPFIMFTSDHDRALWASALLAQDGARLGRVENLDELQDMDIIVIDASNFSDGDNNHHMTAVTSPTVIRLLQGISGGAFSILENPVLLSEVLLGAVNAVGSAAEVVLDPVQ